MAKRSDITPELCSKLLRYEGESGKLFWRFRSIEMFADYSRPEMLHESWNRRFSGKEAFTFLAKTGYRSGNILCNGFLAHRVIWAIVFQRWPTDILDHINGIRCDNRIENLREATKKINGRNSKLHSNNTTGVNGVYRCRDRWTAQINTDDKTIHLGVFDTLKSATEARLAANEKYGYSPRHGRG